MFRNVFAFAVVASALALTGCSKCSEQPAAEAPVEAAAPAADASMEAAPAADASMEAAPAADASMEAAPAATPAQ